jgi:hypothetical protein
MMPGVQVLPAVPSFGDKLAEVLGQAGSNIGQGLIERNQRSNDQKIMNQLASNPNATSMDMIKAFTNLSKSTQATLAPLMQQYIKGQEAQQTAELKAKKGGLGDVPEAEKNLLQGVLNRWHELQEKGNVGITNVFHRGSADVREDVAEYDTLRASIEAALLPLVNKGTLAKPRFDYIMSNIPTANDTIATQRGKMKGLAREFGLEVPFGKKEEKETPFKKVEKGTILKKSDPIARKIYEQADKDPQKAKDLAEKMGYILE